MFTAGIMARLIYW